MKYNRISILAMCLSAVTVTATAQNVTLHKQGGVGQVYEVEKVDSVVYFPIGDAEQFPASEEENTTTLWDVIQAQPNLKKFAAVMEAADYYTGKGKPSTGITFSRILSGNVPVTVYAPTDEAVSEDKYAELLSLARTDGWRLQQEFILNHISPQEGNTAGAGDVMMLNGKHIAVSNYNVTPANLACNNGQLYTAASCFPYLANLQEYLTDLAPDCTLARQFMASLEGDSKTLDAGNTLSVPTKDGNMQVLDSIFRSGSRITDQYLVNDDVMRIKGIGADLADENASYSMVMPTDAVWNDALAKLAPLFRYSSRYDNKVKGDQGIRNVYLDIANPDFLSAIAIGADIFTSLSGRTAAGEQTSLSNGTAYTAAEWPVPLSEYKPDVEVELTGKENFYYVSSTSYYKAGEAALYDVSSPELKDITDRYGDVSNGNFLYLPGQTETYNPQVEVKLTGKNGEQVMSGLYDIQVVMVPNWYRMMTTPEDAELLKDELFTDSLVQVNLNKISAQVRYNTGGTSDKTSSKVTTTYTPAKVDTITVIENFEFPYSYANISDSYPTLIIQSSPSNSDIKKGYVRELCIDRIILRSKQDGSVIDVIP